MALNAVELNRNSSKQFVYEDTVTIECLHGFWFGVNVFTATATCDATGRWNSLPQECTREFTKLVIQNTICLPYRCKTSAEDRVSVSFIIALAS